ncbi:MAG: hypothetical protein IJK81_02890 [Selenomonadaceae bacterium]|nr:hypothetical protein [Selenomonadaceae bacterium]
MAEHISAAAFTEDENGSKVGSNCNLTYSGDGDLVLDSDVILTSNLRFKILKNGSVIAVKPHYATAPT